MVKVQYVGDDHTTVQIDKKSSVKTKVVNGEIIEVSPELAKALSGREFRVVDDKVQVKVEDDGSDHGAWGEVRTP